MVATSYESILLVTLDGAVCRNNSIRQRCCGAADYMVGTRSGSSKCPRTNTQAWVVLKCIRHADKDVGSQEGKSMGCK